MNALPFLRAQMTKQDSARRFAVPLVLAMLFSIVIISTLFILTLGFFTLWGARHCPEPAMFLPWAALLSGGCLLAYIIAMVRTRQAAVQGSEATENRWEAITGECLAYARVITLGSSFIAVPTLSLGVVLARANPGYFGYLAAASSLLASVVWLPAHLLAGCLYAIALVIQAFLPRWFVRGTIGSGVYTMICLSILAVIFYYSR
jgi:hypothetical protein